MRSGSGNRLSKAIEWFTEALAPVERIPWAFLVFFVVALGGLYLIGFGGLSWGDYLGAVTVAAGLHGVGHGIREHGNARKDQGSGGATT